MFGERLSELIEILGLNYSEFSKIVGFSRPYVTLLANGGRTAPSSRFYDAVCRRFRVNEEWLRDGRGEMFVDTGEDISIMDMVLINKYNLLPDEEKVIVDEIVDSLLVRKLCRQKDEKAEK